MRVLVHKTSVYGRFECKFSCTIMLRYCYNRLLNICLKNKVQIRSFIMYKQESRTFFKMCGFPVYVLLAFYSITSILITSVNAFDCIFSM